jgi:hypothetical protein
MKSIILTFHERKSLIKVAITTGRINFQGHFYVYDIKNNVEGRHMASKTNVNSSQSTKKGFSPKVISV